MRVPRRRVVLCAFVSRRVLVVFLLCRFASCVWSQQSSYPNSNTGSNADASIVQQPQAVTPQAMSDDHSMGSIHGVVVSPDGSVYEGAQITLVETGPGSAPTKTIPSDSQGRFQFNNVPQGPFRLTVTSSGFATQVRSGILRAGENYDTQSIVLLISTASSDVRVTASQPEIAAEQLKMEEQQRVFGVLPNFYVAYAPDAPPLTSKQKFSLAWKSSIDPVTFVITGAFAGVEQANDTFSGYGQGTEGYAKRFGANYADNFIGTMIGSAILPSILKQDPRYFYKGTGTTHSRVLYAIANAVVCKGDNGHWQPNYSGYIGGLAAGGISNLYYPASDRDGVTLIFENLLIGTAEAAAQNLVQEFIVRKLTPKVPKYGPSNP